MLPLSTAAQMKEVMHQPDSQLPHRPRNAHKGDFGRVFILAGSEGYTGAPRYAVCYSEP